jgi:cell division protein FtsB
VADAQSSPEAQPEPRKSPFQRLRLTNWQIILIALVVIGGRLVIDFSQRIVEGQQKIAEQRSLEAENETLLDEQQQLEADKAYYASQAYVEAWAHDEGKMVKDGEKLVIPLYTGPVAPVEEVPVVQPQAPLTPPEIWWTLFFDSPPPF